MCLLKRDEVSGKLCQLTRNLIDLCSLPSADNVMKPQSLIPFKTLESVCNTCSNIKNLCSLLIQCVFAVVDNIFPKEY
jgi:hypothetical protein